MTLSQVRTDIISDTSVNILHSVLNEAKKYPSVNTTCTRNGFQSYNFISFIPNSVLQEIYNKAQKYLDSVVSNCIYYEFYIDYIHLIHYNTNGWQVGHTHSSLEDHSFIIYLNNSDGDTVLYEGKEIVNIIPETGKVVFFNSHYHHESLVCSCEKKIAAGSIRFRHKIWEPR